MAFYHKTYCSYTGVRGFVTLYGDALRYRYMITEKARYRAKVLAFWEQHGLPATLDAFPMKRRTLFSWKKKLKDGFGKLETLNEASRMPRTKRSRSWPMQITSELKRIREEHPNLGKEKVYPLLRAFCAERNLRRPSATTIGRLIHDAGGLRTFPQKVRHDGTVVPRKRERIQRKPKYFIPYYPGHLVALDTIERFVHGCRRYIITFEDIHTRFSFAWATTSHASLAAKEFFDRCRVVFPVSCMYTLTDNGSEFKKYFAQELARCSVIHWRTYPRCPRMNGHLERFNRTLQEEFVDYHVGALLDPDAFNLILMDWLVWYNTERVHCAFKNKLSPMQYLLTLPASRLPQECKNGWPYTTP